MNKLEGEKRKKIKFTEKQLLCLPDRIGILAWRVQLQYLTGSRILLTEVGEEAKNCVFDFKTETIVHQQLVSKELINRSYHNVFNGEMLEKVPHLAWISYPLLASESPVTFN